MEKNTHKSTYIIITIIMVSIIIIYGLWIFISYKNKTGFFTPYNPVPNPDTELYMPFSSTPLTAEQIEVYKANKKIIICNACRKLSENNNILVPVINESGDFVRNDNITKTTSFCAQYLKATDCTQTI